MREAIKDENQLAMIIANDFGANATYVEDLLRQFRHDPTLVGEEWGGTSVSCLDRANPMEWAHGLLRRRWR